MENTEKYMEDLDIDIMSIIVDDWKPKNGKRAIVKGAKGKQIVIKAIDIKGLLFATVVCAGITDLDGEKITNEEVEKSCWNYQTKVMEKGFKLDMNHDGKEIEGVKLVENSVNRSDENYSHEIVIDFHENKELMEKAVNSSIKGVSPKGHARIVEKGAFEKAFDKIASVLKSIKTDFDRDIEKINKGEQDMKKELADFVATDEGKKELETLGFVTKPETSKETLEKAEPEKAPETISKAEFDAYKADLLATVTDLKTQLIEVAKGRATGADELAPEVDIDKMSNDEIKTLRETKPDLYKAALEKAAEKRK